MKMLYIIREKGHELALSTALAMNQSGSGQAQPVRRTQITLLLIHDAVLTGTDALKGLEAFALREDVEARGVGARCNVPLRDYDGMLELIFESDKIITW
jgi:sulfur relay protein TusB/DsrH